MEVETAEKLSEAERNALEFLCQQGGGVLTSAIPDKTVTDWSGSKIAGMAIYEKLDKRGLVVITEEDPMLLDDGEEFTFTNEIYITDKGRNALM